jgi:phage terminase large subunit-like protein
LPRATLSRIASAPGGAQAAVLRLIEAAAPQEREALERHWPFWARPDQLAPAGSWRTWLLLGGRGAGKTRAGAEWVRSEVEGGRLGRVALVGPTLADVREVMIEGPSGLRALGRSGRVPLYQPSRRRLEWSSGAVAYAFSAEDPDSLRGPQFDGAWLDEFAAWRDAQSVYDTLQFGLRIGESPRQTVTTTPRPIAAVRRLVEARDTVISRAATIANAANLAPEFIAKMYAAHGRTLLGRQELLGELIEEAEGALWSRADLERVIRPAPESLERIVVGVDPPASEGAAAAACGIVVAGVAGRGFRSRVWVLADCTLQGASPHVWARRVIDAAREFDADKVVAEVNQGGALVRTLLGLVDSGVPISEVRATRGKRARAEPVATLYQTGRVFHADRFPALEDELCSFGALGPLRGSADRVDALVWAVTSLVLDEPSAVRLRRL